MQPFIWSKAWKKILVSSLFLFFFLKKQHTREMINCQGMLRFHIKKGFAKNFYQCLCRSKICVFSDKITVLIFMQISKYELYLDIAKWKWYFYRRIMAKEKMIIHMIWLFFCTPIEFFFALKCKSYKNILLIPFGISIYLRNKKFYLYCTIHFQKMLLQNVPTYLLYF